MEQEFDAAKKICALSVLSLLVGGVCPKMKQLVPQERFALFECTLVFQQWFALFGYFFFFVQAYGQYALKLKAQ